MSYLSGFKIEFQISGDQEFIFVLLMSNLVAYLFL